MEHITAERAVEAFLYLMIALSAGIVIYSVLTDWMDERKRHVDDFMKQREKNQKWFDEKL